jgi:L-asparaginase II
MRADRASYTDPQHPVQQAVKTALEGLAGVSIGDECTATDGCSVPTWALPLASIARAFARFGTGCGLEPVRAKAAELLRHACAERPFHMAGTDRFCTKLMQHFGTRLLVKAGAEGMMCAAMPEQGLGIAVKCDDGASRAAEVVMAALLGRFMLLGDADRVFLESCHSHPLRNWRGLEVGFLRPTAALDLAAAKRL